MAFKIHETAIVSPLAKLGEDVTIGPYSIINDNVYIGDRSVIGSNCELGIPTPLANTQELIIGDESNIRSHSIFYIGSEFGNGLITGHRVTVRENTLAGVELQLGTLCDIQGHCTFGNFVRFHSNVHIGQKSKIGDYVWIFPYVVLTNDPHPPSSVKVGCEIADFAAIAAMSTVMPGVKIGRGALVGAMTLVRDDVPSDSICVGVPGKVIGKTSKIKFTDSDQSAYPWRRHFHRGYPSELVQEWIAEFADLESH